MSTSTTGTTWDSLACARTWFSNSPAHSIRIPFAQYDLFIYFFLSLCNGTSHIPVTDRKLDRNESRIFIPVNKCWSGNGFYFCDFF